MLRRIINRTPRRLFSNFDQGIQSKLSDVPFLKENFNNNEFQNSLYSLYKKGGLQIESISNEYVASALFDKLSADKQDEDALLLVKVLSHKKSHQRVLEAAKHLIKTGYPVAARELIEEQKAKGILLDADKVETLFK